MAGSRCDEINLEKKPGKFSRFRSYIMSGQNQEDYTLMKTGYVDDSMTPKRIDTRATKEPGGRARPLLRFLAIGVLILGIFGIAPIAMASDITTDTGFMAPAISGGVQSGGLSLQDIVAPETGCRDHVASCFHDQYM